MARTGKPAADDKTVEGVAHDHGDGDAHHTHRLGDLPHLHREDGKAVLLDEHGKPLFDGDDTAPPGGHHADVFNGEGERQAAERRAAIAAAVTPAEIAEMEEIGRTHHAIARPSQPRPVAVSGAPGSRLADVSSFSSTLTLFGIPAELQDELTWAQIGKQCLDAMIEEVIHTRQPADPALVSAALDAVLHIGKARGLA